MRSPEEVQREQVRQWVAKAEQDYRLMAWNPAIPATSPSFPKKRRKALGIWFT